MFGREWTKKRGKNFVSWARARGEIELKGHAQSM